MGLCALVVCVGGAMVWVGVGWWCVGVGLVCGGRRHTMLKIPRDMPGLATVFCAWKKVDQMRRRERVSDESECGLCLGSVDVSVG